MNRIIVHYDVLIGAVLNPDHSRNASECLWAILERRLVESYITPFSLNRIYGFLSLSYDTKIVEQVVDQILEITRLCPKVSALFETIDLLNFTDVEYVVELAYARAINCDAIVTQSFEKFAKADAEFSIWSVGELLQRIRMERHIDSQISSTEGLITKLNMPTSLRQWFDGIYDKGWDTPENIGIPSPATRPPVNWIRRAKRINVGMQTEVQGLGLLITLVDQPDSKLGIRVELHPSIGKIWVPHNLRLILLSERGETLSETTSTNRNEWIQSNRTKIPFSRNFKVEVIYDTYKFTEEFVV